MQHSEEEEGRRKEGKKEENLTAKKKKKRNKEKNKGCLTQLAVIFLGLLSALARSVGEVCWRPCSP